MDVVIVVGLLAFFLVLWLGAIAAVVSAARTEHVRWRRVQRGKGVTIVLIILTGGFGGVYYWWRIRPELRRANSANSAITANSAMSPTAAVAPTKAQRRAIEAQRYLGR